MGFYEKMKTNDKDNKKEEKEINNAVNDKTPKLKVVKPPIIESIEEDDEFEEFEPCNWGTADEDAEDAQQWQDNWDDDDIDDDFTKNLRAELIANSKKS